MCLAMPMEVIAIDGCTARCSANGVTRHVSLFLLQGDTVSVGDFVVVHVGYAVQKITPEEGRSAWELYDRDLAVHRRPKHA